MHELDAFLKKLNEKTHARSTCRFLQPLMGIQTRANPKYSLLLLHPLPALKHVQNAHWILSAVSLWGFTAGLLYVLDSLFCRHNFNHLMFFSLACLLMILMNVEKDIFLRQIYLAPFLSYYTLGFIFLPLHILFF